MTHVVKWGKPSRRKDGHVGARMSVAIKGEGGADGIYAIDTHGLNSDQVAAKVDEIGMFHAARSGRMDGFRSIQATPIIMDQATYRVVDLTVHYPQDASRCTLYIDVRQIVGGEKVRVAGFPRRIMYASPALLPDDETLVSLIVDAIPVEREDIVKLHEAFVEKVAEKVHKKSKRNGGE
jgi:hypothetical protein